MPDSTRLECSRWPEFRGFLASPRVRGGTFKLKRHLLCLTLDTDPDGLNAKVPNRESLEWEGLIQVQRLPEELNDFSDKIGRVPMTWFVRADGQLERTLGHPAYLLETHGDFWAKMEKAGDEVGWHPHLYYQGQPGDAVQIIADPFEASDELERLWNSLKTTFNPTAFRNGEGWHLPKTYSTVERLGFRCDSTAIPGRRGGSGHPMNWEGGPNQPYFPGLDDLCKSGPIRAMVELPMNTWHVQASYDAAPRIRYMNPAVHPHLFADALRSWEDTCKAMSGELFVWVMIFHPDEVLTSRGPDALYSRSMQKLCFNLLAMSESLQRLGHEFEWLTVSHAAERWRVYQQWRAQFPMETWPGALDVYASESFVSSAAAAG
jgi:hypothetical protein